MKRYIYLVLILLTSSCAIVEDAKTYIEKPLKTAEGLGESIEAQTGYEAYVNMHWSNGKLANLTIYIGASAAEIEDMLQFNKQVRLIVEEHYEEVPEAVFLSFYLKSVEEQSAFFLQRGMNDGGAGRYNEAIENFSKVIALDSNSFPGYYNRAAQYNAWGKKSLAIQDYNKALILKPDEVSLYHNRAITYRDINKDEKALQDYARIIELAPNDLEAYYWRGLIYDDQGKYKQAIADYNKVIEIDPNHANAYSKRGHAYKSLRQYRMAVNDWNAYLRINGNQSGDAEWYRNLIRAYDYTPNY